MFGGYVKNYYRIVWSYTTNFKKISMETTMEKELKSKVSNLNPERKEGPVAKAIESQTAKLPSDTFLWAAVGAMTASLTLKLLGKNHTALFIGQWAPSFLLLGVYNKIVKVEGHD
jgi:hypothetical protein